MAPRLDSDVLYIVVGILRAEYASSQKSKRETAKKTLIALRLTSRFLAEAAGPALLSHIEIKRLGLVSQKRLQSLLQSPTACQSVRTYDLKPEVIGSRQGDLTTPYHKIPPYLDYGRNSASPQIQAENRKLRLAEVHWQEQNEIIYPIKNKVASSLAKTFKYASHHRGECRLKDSIFFSALDAFVNLTTLHVLFPSPRPMKPHHDVAHEFNVALGRYLATNPAHLNEFRAHCLMPEDFVTMINVMKQGIKENDELALNITKLDLGVENTEGPIHESLHVYPDFSSSLSLLLQHTPRLQILRVVYRRDAPQMHLRHLLLSPFSPPPLPDLKAISLIRFTLAPDDLIALINYSPLKLKTLFLDSISLTGPSWARVLRAFGESKTMESVRSPVLQGMSYNTVTASGAVERGQTDVDHKAFVEWKSQIDAKQFQYEDYMFEGEADNANTNFWLHQSMDALQV